MKPTTVRDIQNRDLLIDKKASWHQQRGENKGRNGELLRDSMKTVSYDSFAHTLHSQDPLGRTFRHLRHTLWLHILHWLEKRLSRLRGSRHLPQICWLYLPLPRLAPFLFTSSKSVFSFLWQKHTHHMFPITDTETHSTTHLFKSHQVSVELLNEDMSKAAMCMVR